MKHKRTVNCFISALLLISLLPGLPPVTASAKETDAVNTISHGRIAEEDKSVHSSDYSHDELWITRWAAGQVCENYDAGCSRTSWENSRFYCFSNRCNEGLLSTGTKGQSLRFEQYIE